MTLTNAEIRALSRIIDERNGALDPLAGRRERLQSRQQSKVRRPRAKGRPNLCVVEASPLLPCPPGFEDLVIRKHGYWRPADTDALREERAKELWRLWLNWMEPQCPFADTEPDWAYRYDSPDMRDLVDRLPELAKEHRRRFGTPYLRLVRDYGKAVSA